MIKWISEKKDILEHAVTILFFIGFFCVMFVCISEKTNLHCDEVYTYVLSNNTYQDTGTVAPECYVIYENPESVWLNTMTVQEGQQFNFENVWHRQSCDTHPPFYYALVHFVSSFFVGTYSKWFAGSINILFALLTLYAVRKIVMELTAKKSAVFFTMCCFVFSAGVLSAITFFRMYTVAMFLTTMVTYLFIKGIEKSNATFYIMLFVTSVLGALTHYYFVIYLVVSSVVFTAIMIIKKNWKTLCVFVSTMIVSAITAIAIFPTMIEHVFGGSGRGGQTMDIWADMSFFIFGNRLKTGFAILNNQLFSGLFWYVVGAIFIFAGIVFIRSKKNQNKMICYIKNNSNKIMKWVMICIPSVAYYIIVSMIAVYITDRYFHLIYAVLLIVSVTMLCVVAERAFNKKIAFITVLIILLVTTFKEFDANWYYLYRSTQTFLDRASVYSEVDCIHVFANHYEIDPSFYEAKMYDRIVFIPDGDINVMGDLGVRTDNGLVLTIGTACDFEAAKAHIQEIWPELDSYEEIGRHSFSVSYYFYK